METLEELIDAQLIDVYCSRCRHTTPKELKSLRTARDMHCPMCDAMIVLNTSKMKNQIRTMERQMRSLHCQLMDTITARALSAPEAPEPVSLEPRPRR